MVCCATTEVFSSPWCLLFMNNIYKMSKMRHTVHLRLSESHAMITVSASSTFFFNLPDIKILKLLEVSQLQIWHMWYFPLWTPKICHDAPNLKEKSKLFSLTCWCVCEGSGVVSQLLPPAVSTVQPPTEAHQHQPRSHAQSRDEGWLPNDARDLLWDTEVTAFLHGCFVHRESWRKRCKVWKSKVKGC